MSSSRHVPAPRSAPPATTAAPASAAETALRAAGLRVTRPRLTVMEVLDSGAHLEAERVAALARERLGQVSTQAVYDALHAFARAGLVRRIEPAGSPALYETRTGDNHHHVVCRSCGTVADVDCAVGRVPCIDTGTDPAAAHGFDLDEAEITFWGLCPSCQPHDANAHERSST